MKIIITGASGFIGGALLDRLRGAHEVICLSSSETGRARLLERHPDQEVYIWKRGADERMNAAISGAAALVHLAWSTVPRTADQAPALDLLENVQLGIPLLDLALRSGVERFIFLSSGGSVYGPQEELPITEDRIPRPLSAYGISKLAFEHYLGSFCARGSMRPIIFRPGNIYGRARGLERPQGVIEHWMHQIAEERPIAVWGDLSVVRDFVHIDDMIEVLMRALTYEGEHDIFNVGTGVGTSLAQILEMLSGITGRQVQITHHPPATAGMPDRNILSPQRLSREFGFLPEGRLQNGLAGLWRKIEHLERSGA